MPKSLESSTPLSPGDISAVIQMAWEDRTTFETIYERTGVTEPEPQPEPELQADLQPEPELQPEPQPER